MKRLLIIIIVGSSVAFAQPHRSAPFDPFLDTLQHRTFNYFWVLTNPANGLTPDRAPAKTFSSVAAVGFALTAYPIGVERRYVTRVQAAQRALTTIKFFWTAAQSPDRAGATGYKGLFYHFLHMDSGVRYKDVELSTIDTGLLLAGMLMCQSYFTGTNQVERDIRAYADSVYRRADWQWAMNGKSRLGMGWDPENGFISDEWKGYNEAMILYVLALGSPTHPIAGDAWTEWTKTYLWASYYGSEFVSFGPLFGHQYSHCWIDFRGIRDAYMRTKNTDYFENSRRATLSQQAYAQQNPRHYRDYSGSIWGLTACDGPGDVEYTVDGVRRRFEGYAARGASVDWTNDDGTIAPTAAGGSVAFAPEICIPALKAMKAAYGAKLWRMYGFIDAFNPTFVKQSPDGWFDDDYLGIDQGPIVIMIENLRSGFVWNTMKKNQYIERGLRRAGFSGGWLDKNK
jgi:hypothetical protein